MDKEQEMKALERYLASCNEAKEQVILQMELEEVESEKNCESGDDMFNEGRFMLATHSYNNSTLVTSRIIDTCKDTNKTKIHI